MEHYATINYDDGWIRFEPGYRLGRGEYEQVKAVGLVWKRSEECFVAPWTPALEDFLRKEFDVALEPDGTDLLKVAQGRAAYYEQYSQNATRRSQQAHRAADALSERFAFGQPILVGHHSEKGARRDSERLAANMDKAIEAAKRATYWDARAQETMRRAAARYTPLALSRRIEAIEAEIRKHQKTIQQYDEVESMREENAAATREMMERLFYANMSSSQLAASRAYIERWLTFFQARLEVAQALYEESGGVAHDQGKLTLEIGGAVKYRGYWYGIKTVNQKTVTTNDWLGFMAYKLKLTELEAAMTKAQWEQADKYLQRGVGYRLREKKADDDQVQG